jgi:uncharacterized protein
MHQLGVEILDAILETIPLELTVLDEDDRIVWWNEVRSRIFERPSRIRGQDVRACHSEKSLAMLERMLREMKAGERGSARFWYDQKKGDGGERKKILVEYYALRNSRGAYLGCVEAVRAIDELRFLDGEKRTLD